MATTTSQQRREFNLQPTPRILPILGEINLPQWRCVAELIDNSVDGFLHAQRSGQSIEEPEVHINVPTVDSPGSKISVRDNGPGMSPETLEMAVRAGWTGNDPINNLGLFGMGFNIATAKLGRVTTVWTVRREDGEWSGLRIDFDALVKQGHFLTPALTRPKADPEEHGTEIVVELLKPEQRQWFAQTNNRAQLNRNLREAYGTMLRPEGKPIGFALFSNGTKVSGVRHCLWDGNGVGARETILPPPIGTVATFQSIDTTLPPRPFCTACWQWLSAGSTQCPSCQAEGNVVERTRRVYGWLGIQRYLHETDYGIDFLRNGRKIEVRSKEIFEWQNPEDSSVEKEYPIDDHRRLGRIVGEIHIDHCRVSYMKDRFERTDPAWEEMLRIVRGEGPLRPEIARERGFDPANNHSPLFKLYQAYRRSSPYKKIAGCYQRLVLVPPEWNGKAQKMADNFRSGEALYSTDAKWWELVEEGDRNLLKGDSPPSPSSPPSTTPPEGEQPGLPSGAGPLPGFSGPSTGPGAVPGGESAPSPQVPPARAHVPSLSQEYREPASGQRYNVVAFEAQAADPDLRNPDRAWRLKADVSGVFNYVFNPSHQVFASSTLTPLDALLTQIAWLVADHQRSLRAEPNFELTLANLRDAYSGPTKIDPAALSASAAAILNAIAACVSKGIAAAEGAALYRELSDSEQEDILGRMVTRQVAAPKMLLDAGRFLEFASRTTLVKVFRRFPELFFDGRCWDDSYATVDLPTAAATEKARQERVQYFAGLLQDALWLAEGDPTSLAESSRARLLRSALALDLLTPDE